MEKWFALLHHILALDHAGRRMVLECFFFDNVQVSPYLFLPLSMGVMGKQLI